MYRERFLHAMSSAVFRYEVDLHAVFEQKYAMKTILANWRKKKPKKTTEEKKEKEKSSRQKVTRITVKPVIRTLGVLFFGAGTLKNRHELLFFERKGNISQNK